MRTSGRCASAAPVSTDVTTTAASATTPQRERIMRTLLTATTSDAARRGMFPQRGVRVRTHDILPREQLIAAERRQNVAHGASRGFQAHANAMAPEGRNK